MIFGVRAVMEAIDAGKVLDKVLVRRDMSSAIGRENIVADTLEEAYAFYENDHNEDACYIVTGSLFVAGGIREIHMKNDDSIRYFG